MVAKHIRVTGKNTVIECLKSMGVSDVYLPSSLNKTLSLEITELARKKGVRVNMGRDSDEIFANVEAPLADLDSVLNKKNPLILLLNHIDYEQNLGAILRTAWASGVDIIIASPNGVCEVTEVVSKISMGGAGFVPVLSMSLFSAIDKIRKAGISVVGVEVDRGDVYTRSALIGPLAILMGGEFVGLSEPLIKKCDRLVHVPMSGGIASLNVSVATALILFERLRQNRS